MVKKWWLGLCVCALFLGGCAQTALQEVKKEYYFGDPKQALKIARKEKKSDPLLWGIQEGTIAMVLGKEVIPILDATEDLIKEVELKGYFAEFFENLGALAMNENVMKYHGFLYEWSMVNYYKALAYLKNTDSSNARVEFNRASDRQRRAKEFYEQEIQKALQRQNKLPKQEINSANIGTQEILKQYSNLESFSKFKGYINPMIDYVSGIFLIIEGDYGRAIDFLKEAYGVSQSPIIARDLEYAHNPSGQKYTWILIEDGEIASKQPFRFDVDLPIWTSRGMRIFSLALALPKLKEGKASAQTYRLKNQDQQIAQATSINSLSVLAFNEFARQIPLIITRSILSAILKTGMQVGLSQMDGASGLVGSLFAMIYTHASTQADIRMVNIFPHRFLVLRVENQVGEFGLFADEKQIANLSITQECVQDKACVSRHNLVYLRNTGKNVFYQFLFSK